MKRDKEVIEVSQDPVGGQKMPILFYQSNAIIVLLY